MRPLGLCQPREKELARDKPVLTSLGIAEARHQSALAKATASAKRVDEKKRLAFDRERASVRSWVNRSMENMLEGVGGLVQPGVLDPPVAMECRTFSPRQTVKKTEGPKGRASDAVPEFFSPACVMGKPTLASPGAGRKTKKKTCSVEEVATAPGSPGEGQDGVMGCPMPQGFPLSFEESGFQCLTHWANVSFQEVLLTALGPRSERERRGKNEPNNRLLVSVACYLLNEVLTRDANLSGLWSQMRDVIFKAVFAPPTVHQTQEADGCKEPPDLCFEKRQHYKGLRLWSDAFLTATREKARLSERITEMQGVVRKSRLILRFAQRRVDRMRVEYAFCAWRKTIQRERAFREAAMKYVKRLRERMYIEGCFLRWRRVAAGSHVSDLTRMMKESEVRLALLEQSSNKAMASLSKQLEEEQKSIKILKMGKEALKSQLAESHVLALRTINNELRQHQLNVIAAKKHSKRWERLAKTFAIKTTCLVVPHSIRKTAVSLRRIEDDLAQKALTTRDLPADARRNLEVLLLDWVNFFMKNSPGGVFWHRVVKIDTGFSDGDFGALGLLRLVRALEALYVKMGMRRSSNTLRFKPEEEASVSPAEGNQGGLTNRPTDFLLIELKRLLYLQTMEGAFPSLLLHCPIVESFLDPEFFCQVPHPTAMLWVLATLFVGYVRLACGGPVVASGEMDSTLRCHKEAVLRNEVWGSVPKEVAETREGAFVSKRTSRSDSRPRIVASNTTIRKNSRLSVWRKSLSLQIEVPAPVDDEVSMSSDLIRLADTQSDLEVYLGLDQNDDECSSSNNSSNNGSPCVTPDSWSASCTTIGTNASPRGKEDNANTAGVPFTGSLDAERLRRVQRKAHLIPPVNNALSAASLHEFVQLNQQEFARRRTWLGVSRVVTSLVVRFRILDIGLPVVPQKPAPAPNKKEKSPATRPPARPEPSKLGREFVRFVPPAHAASDGPDSEKTVDSPGFALRGILGKSRWLQKK